MSQVIVNDGAANGALTVTIPGAAGKMHAVRRVHLYRTATLSIAGSAVLAITTTNLPASLAWSVGNGISAGGSTDDVDESYDGGNLVSLAAGVDTTFVMPAPGVGVTWHAIVHYDLTP